MTCVANKWNDLYLQRQLINEGSNNDKIAFKAGLITYLLNLSKCFHKLF